jgi:DnaJ-class molecular chaperone
MRKAKTRRIREHTLAALITCYVCHGLGYLVTHAFSPRLCPHCAGAGFITPVQEAA